jgi:hypothetical protein
MVTPAYLNDLSGVDPDKESSEEHDYVVSKVSVESHSNAI